MSIELWVSELERDFERQLTPLNLQSCVELLVKHGCLVLRNLFPRQLIEELSEAYYRVYGDWEQTELRQQGLVVGDLRIMHCLPLATPFDQADFFISPLLRPLFHFLLGPRFVLNSSFVVVALPGAEKQRLHRDNDFPYGPCELSLKLPPYLLQLAIPLIDLSTETGTTKMFTGSHQELLPVKDYQQRSGSKPLLRMGDAYLMDYRLVHGGTPNRARVRRPLIYLAYARNWYFDSENTLDHHLAPLIVPRETMAKVSPADQYLLSRGALEMRPQAP